MICVDYVLQTLIHLIEKKLFSKDEKLTISYKKLWQARFYNIKQTKEETVTFGLQKYISYNFISRKSRNFCKCVRDREKETLCFHIQGLTSSLKKVTQPGVNVSRFPLGASVVNSLALSGPPDSVYVTEIDCSYLPWIHVYISFHNTYHFWLSTHVTRFRLSTRVTCLHQRIVVFLFTQL